MADFEELTRQLLEHLGSEAYARVSPQIGSQTLRAALELIVDVPGSEARLFIPHYWAVYYHDGRSGFGPVDANFLVYFTDPKDDPRLPNGELPERAASVRRLTRAEFYFGIRQNTFRREQGLPPYMLVIQNEDGSPGTVGPAVGHPFFDNNGGMRGFAEEQSSPDSGPAELFDRFIQQMVDQEINPPRQSGHADIVIDFDL